MSPANVTVYDISDVRRKLFAEELKVNVHPSNDSAVASSDVAILAVKPQYLSSTARTVSSQSWENKLVLSIAAGVTIETLKSLLPPSARVVRIMPNTPCLYGMGASAYFVEEGAPEKDVRMIETIMKWGFCGF